MRIGYEIKTEFNKSQNFITNMKSILKKRIKSTPNQIQYSILSKTQQLAEDQLKMPLKPFEGKFTPTKQSQIIQSRRQSVVSIKQTHNQMDERRIHTQAETNDIYESDFEDYQQQSFEDYQTVQQQNQNPFQAINPQIQSQPGQIDGLFQWYSIKQMNMRNNKLVENIQFFRHALQRYKLNITKIQKQQKQLNKLKQLKNKAVDYTYELQLERQTANKTDLSKSQVSSIRQASVMLKKEKYKLTKESHRKAYPNVFEQQSLSPEKKQQSSDLQMVRQQLLCKKRQFYSYKQQIKQLQEKIKFYQQTLDKLQSRQSLMSTESLQRRKKQLQEEIILKKTIIQQSEIEFNLQISNLNNQIAALQIQTIKINQEGHQIKEKIRQYQQSNNPTPKTKPSIANLFRKKSTFEYNQHKSPIKIPKVPQTPRAITRFYYNPNKNRNSSIFHIPQI